jgi:hypothetical protein
MRYMKKFNPKNLSLVYNQFSLYLNVSNKFGPIYSSMNQITKSTS